MPSYIDAQRLPDLVAARAAIDGAPAPQSAEEAAEIIKGAEARLMSQADEVRQRAEAERELAAEVRSRAEALSARFATELANETRAATIETGSIGPRPTRVGSAVQDERVAGSPSTASMKRAAEALARARNTLDEADRRAAATNTNAPVWDAAQVEIATARREAAEAVERAEQALKDPALAATSGPARAVEPVATATAPKSDTAGATAARPKRMIPPYALGATLR